MKTQKEQLWMHKQQINEQTILIEKQKQHIISINDIQKRMEDVLVSMIQQKENGDDMNDAFHTHINNLKTQVEKLELLQSGFVHTTFQAIDQGM